MHDKHIANSTTEDVETAPSVFKPHISEMDSDERDDIPLARLL